MQQLGRNILTTALALAVAGFAGSASASIAVISGNITPGAANTTWGDDEDEIILEGAIFVTEDATLTILPGTIVRGQPRTAAVMPGSTDGTPGALIVAQDGEIFADGDGESPIVWTTAATDNDDDGVCDDDVTVTFPGGGEMLGADGFCDPWAVGDVFLDDDPNGFPLAPVAKDGSANVSLWGGVVINGEAPTNLGDNLIPGMIGKGTIEGLTIPGFPVELATYGGENANDSSGSFTFNSVRHAGDEIGANNELNGVSLGGVGRGTIFKNNEVYVNFDDGIEWFGGTVDGENLAVIYAGDDSIDIAQGYTGQLQNLFGISQTFDDFETGGSFGSGSGDNGGELDGDDLDERGGDAVIRTEFIDPDGPGPGIPTVGAAEGCHPRSNPIISNWTIIGTAPPAGADVPSYDTQCTAAGVPFGCCTGAGTGSCDSGDDGRIDFRNGFVGVVQNSMIVNTGGQAAISVDTALDGCPGFDLTANIAADITKLVCSTIDDSGALGADALALIANGDDEVAGVADDTVVNSFLFNGLVNEDTTFDPTGNADGKLVAGLKSAPIDPRPAPGFSGVLGCAAPLGSALDPSETNRGAFFAGAPLFTTPWSVLNQAGLLAD